MRPPVAQTASPLSLIGNRAKFGGSIVPSGRVANSLFGDTSILEKHIARARASIAPRRQTIRSIAALFTSNIFATTLGAAGGLLVAVFLEPAELGSFRAFTIPLTYLMFLHLGTFDGLWRQIPYYAAKAMREKVDDLASAAGAFHLILAACLSACFVCLAVYCLIWNDLYGVFGWLSQAIVCWSTFYGTFLSSTYRTLDHFVGLARIQATTSVATFSMVFSLPFLGFYGMCARVANASLLEVWLLHRDRPLRVKYRLHINAIKELIRIGFPFSFWGSLYSNVWVATESALVLSLGGATDLGLFAVAYTLRGAVNTLPLAVWNVLTPRIVLSVTRDGNIRNTNARVMRASAALAILMIVIACVGGAVLDALVPIFIPKYVAGIPVMKLFLWFAVVQAAHIPITSLFAAGRPWLFGRGVLLGVTVFALTTYFILPLLGTLLAVAIGSLAGRIARTLAAYLDVLALAKRVTS